MRRGREILLFRYEKIVGSGGGGLCKDWDLG